MMETTRSPLAPAAFPSIPPVRGVRFAACTAELRYRGRPDLALVELAEGTSVAGVFTRSAVPATRSHGAVRSCHGASARGLVVNAGNANVLVGPAGDATVRAEAEAAAALLGADPETIFVASTGVIGEPLPVEPILAHLPGLYERLEPSAWQDAAEAIRTTDTFAKGSFTTARIGDAEVTVAGIAKGSGMIQPDMATMLAFLFTDADLPASVLQPLLEDANRRSFQATTVDGDSSTSDTLLLFATGQARHRLPEGADDPALQDFRRCSEPSGDRFGAAGRA